MIVTANHNQSIIDLAMQRLGSAEAAHAIAEANGVSITDDLTPGQPIVIPDAMMNRDIAAYYAARAIVPATSVDAEHGTFDETFDLTFY